MQTPLPLGHDLPQPIPVLTNPSTPASSQLKMLHLSDGPVPGQKNCVLLRMQRTEQQLLLLPFKHTLSKPFVPPGFLKKSSYTP